MSEETSLAAADQQNQLSNNGSDGGYGMLELYQYIYGVSPHTLSTVLLRQLSCGGDKARIRKGDGIPEGPCMAHLSCLNAEPLSQGE